MKQLSGIDVNFLNMETATMSGHVASLTIYDVEHAPPGAAGLEATKRALLEKMDELAPYRRRLVEVPFGLDLPYWIDDPDFDIDYHVRHHAIPPPGTPQQLADAISRIHERPLDRRRPLWELYVIEGVDGGRKIAQFTKVHHATIDGASGAQMLAIMLDTEPDARHSGEPARWTTEPVPTDQQMLALTLKRYARNPERFIRLTVRALRELGRATQNGGIKTLAEIVAQPLPGPAGRALRQRLRSSHNEVDDPPALPGTAAPRTPFNASISPHRRFAYTTIPLEDAKLIRRAVGCTFNDVVMALCSSTLRQYLIEHDALPEDPLIAGVPISVRTGEEDDLYQNRVSMLFADLATDEPDPMRRLARVQEAMTAAKEDFAAIPAETLMDFTQFAPPALAARAVRLYSRLKLADTMIPVFNLIISNVPGPSYPLYSAGAKLEHFYPMSAIGEGQGLNMTVHSYNGNLDFGFIVDRELVPDVWRLTELLQQAMADYLAAVGATSTAATRPRAKKATAKAARAKKATTTKSAARTSSARRRSPRRAAATPAAVAG